MFSETKNPDTDHIDRKYEDGRVTTPSDFDQEVASHAPLLHGRKLTAALAFVAGTGFTLFGYVIQQNFGLIFEGCSCNALVMTKA